MCCFSGPVTHVSGTRIFARGLPDGRQSLVYAMTLGAPGDVAMVLPIPVPDDVAEDAVRFVSLEGYEGFFEDVARAFPPMAIAAGFGPQTNDLDLLSLTVHRVGAFVASFVPRAADFGRLDPRFRLPPGVLRAFEGTSTGFVVFQLAEVTTTPGARQPMAFTFPRRDTRALFFPTVHVHDGTRPERAYFDHVLYAQPDDDVAPADTLLTYVFPNGARTTHETPWQPSSGILAGFVDAIRAKGTVDPTRRAYSLLVAGELANEDVIARAR